MLRAFKLRGTAPEIPATLSGLMPGERGGVLTAPPSRHIPSRNRGVYFGHGIYPERSRRVPVGEINATLYFFLGLRSLGEGGSVSLCLKRSGW